MDSPASGPNPSPETPQAPQPPQNPPEKQKTPEPQPVQLNQAEKEAEATLQPSAFPVNGTLDEQFDFYVQWLERPEPDVVLWLELNFVCNFRKIYVKDEKKLKDFFHDTYESGDDLKKKLQDDIDIILDTVYAGRAEASPAHDMVHALAECPQEQRDAFLEELDVPHESGKTGLRKLRLIKQEQILLWRETLDRVKEGNSTTGEPPALEPDFITEPDSQQDIPFKGDIIPERSM